MDITELLSDKSSKAKEKTEALSRAVLKMEITISELVEYAKTAKDPIKATCIEAVEFVTQQKPELVDRATFQFVIVMLGAKAPRIKWEAAKVIGNTVQLHEKDTDEAIARLLVNTEDKGTVVRWSAAYALGEILKLKTTRNAELVPTAEAIIQREEKNSIKKIYQTALKKIGK
ncbi:MAG: hypothetical protein WCG87_07455 [Bacteroidota bacterium]